MSAPGFSKSRFERMQQMLLGYVERKEIPGLVALVSHHDDAQMETFAQIPKSFSVSMAAGDSEWRWIFSATKSSVLHADFGWDGGFGTSAYPDPVVGVID